MPYAPCGCVGSQFRSAYEGSTTLNAASGVTVAITDAMPRRPSPPMHATYARRNGDAACPPRGQFSQSLPELPSRASTIGQRQCAANGWYGEETLDVEAVHAMAQGAKIRYYASASCYDADFLDTFARINDEDAAQIVTNSWSGFESGLRSTTAAAYEQAFLQGRRGGDLVHVLLRRRRRRARSDWNEAGGLSRLRPVRDRSRRHDHCDQLGRPRWRGRRAGAPEVQPLGRQFIVGSPRLPLRLRRRRVRRSSRSPTTRTASRLRVREAFRTWRWTATRRLGCSSARRQTFPDGVYYDQYRIGGTSAFLAALRAA